MILRDPKQFNTTPNLPGMNKTPFDYVKQQNEIRNAKIKKEQMPEQIDKVKELKQLDNQNLAKKFANPMSNFFRGK